MITASWYPDPEWRHRLRYWDGLRWTEHVRDDGVTTLDPLTGDPPPAPTHEAAAGPGSDPDLLLDVHVEVLSSLRTRLHRLRIDAAGVHFDGTTVPSASILGHRTLRTESRIGRPGRVPTYHLVLRTVRGERRLSWHGRNEHPAHVLRAAGDAVEQLVHRRRVEEALQRVQDGETVDLGGWSLSREGAEYGPIRFTWAERVTITEARPDDWDVVVARQGRSRIIGGFSSATPDGRLLLPVMLTLRRRYGR